MELYKTHSNRTGLEVKIFNFYKPRYSTEDLAEEIDTKINNWLHEEKVQAIESEEHFSVASIKQTETQDDITISIWFYYEGD